MAKLSVVPNVSGAPPRRSPERETLAAEIEKHREAASALSAAVSAHAKANDACLAALRSVEQAEEAAKGVKAGLAQHIREVAFGNDSPPPMSTREAHARIAAAQDELDAARDARADIATVREQANQSVGIARGRHDAAVVAVLKSEPAAAEVQRRYAELIDQTTRLGIIARQLGIETRHNDISKEAVSAIAEPWKAARDALKTDPDAELPSV